MLSTRGQTMDGGWHVAVNYPEGREALVALLANAATMGGDDKVLASFVAPPRRPSPEPRPHLRRDARDHSGADGRAQARRDQHHPGDPGGNLERGERGVPPSDRHRALAQPAGAGLWHRG
jgi:hypothetical protein